MNNITLITGSTLGGAEYVADHLAERLEQDGYHTDITNQADLAALTTDTIWLIVCSTHGAGALPDNIQPFFTQLATQKPDLSALKYGVVSLGDSSYDTFCAAGKTLDEQLHSLGATKLGERLDIDISQHSVPEDPAEMWLSEWKKHICG